MTAPNPAEWGFLADDLTGACIVAGKLANAGVPVLVATGIGGRFPEPGSDALLHGGVLGVNTDSRVASPMQAAHRVAEAVGWVQGQGRTRVFKFVDSGLRGNVGAELEAALAHTVSRRALVVPGTPAVGRTVRHGRLYCYGVPAHLAPLSANDPLSPIATDRVVDLFSAHNALSFVSLPGHESSEPEGDAMRTDAGCILVERIEGAHRAGRVPIVDAESADSISSTFDALVLHDRLDALGVLCGSVGLAEAWADWLAVARNAGASRPDRSGTLGSPLVLVVCGSRSSVSQQQVAQLMAMGVPSVACLAEADGGLRPDAAIFGDAWRALRSTGAAVLVPAAEASTDAPTSGAHRVEHAIAFGMAAALGRATESVVAEARAHGRAVALVVVGGMTAVAIMDELKIDFLRPVCEDDFVVHSEATTRDGIPLAIATKGGSAGRPDALARALDRLTRALQPIRPKLLEQGENP